MTCSRGYAAHAEFWTAASPPPLPESQSWPAIAVPARNCLLSPAMTLAACGATAGRHDTRKASNTMQGLVELTTKTGR
jgi:hypothetical protein